MDIHVLRLCALCAAMVVYGGFGSPTPEVFGVVEVVVGGLLMFAVGVSGGVGAVRVEPGQPLWFGAGQVLLCYGLVIGIVGGLVQGQDFRLILRDMIAFLFVFMPLFLWPLVREGKGAAQFLICGVLCGGVLFALRGSPFAQLLGVAEGEVLYYLGNSPMVLFAALFFMGAGVMRISRGLGVGDVVMAGVFFGLAGLAVMPIGATLQRASLAAFLVYAVIAAGGALWRAPRRMGVVLALVACGVFVFWDGVLDIVMPVFEGVRVKSDLVGANSRVEEWQAVWGAVGGSPLSLLFGNGWGAGFSSPAVADIRVNFTHSLLSSMVLKVGVVGVVLTGFYFYALVRMAFGGMRIGEFGRGLFVAAVIAPVLIDVFLYAAYKSLGFGMVLALIPLCAMRGDLMRGLK